LDAGVIRNKGQLNFVRRLLEGRWSSPGKAAYKDNENLKEGLRTQQKSDSNAHLGDRGLHNIRKKFIVFLQNRLENISRETKKVGLKLSRFKHDLKVQILKTCAKQKTGLFGKSQKKNEGSRPTRVANRQVSAERKLPFTPKNE